MTPAVRRAKAQLKRGLGLWVGAYRACREAGNVRAAKKLQREIEGQIKKYKLDPDTVWGTEKG